MQALLNFFLRLCRNIDDVLEEEKKTELTYNNKPTLHLHRFKDAEYWTEYLLNTDDNDTFMQYVQDKDLRKEVLKKVF
jgi:hypothetical protein